MFQKRTNDLCSIFLLILFTFVIHPIQTHSESLDLPENPFTRLTRLESGELKSFETSLVTFVSADGQQRVTLIGAIHIGEKSYYETLNERFRQYEAVLFEMVGNGDPRPETADESTGIVSSIQRLSATAMGLQFQIGSINYQAENFVHADMTENEFQAAMQARGDGLIVWFVRSLGYGFAAYGGDSEDADSLNYLELLVSSQKIRPLRRLSAASMADIQSTSIPVEGKNGSSLIRDRDEKALSILRKQLDEGKKNVAIFYGAAHLPDFAERLQKDFGMKPEKIEWIPCWKLD